jgi:hypothetical protein
MKYLLKVVCLATILSLPHQALAVPCATDYANYRTILLKDKWTPVAVANNIASYTEVSTGTRIATAKWMNPERNEEFLFVLWWQSKRLCVSPQFSIINN